ncbi:hypothetical protein IEQ34_004662 [Dendrobium chrysotoxum]|uniref:Uncharacterized protein n=1 Tax=Dendrobium chrysotoxum TaxID=161865 RepID=A0AAV7HH36_DENCH|nr:hypothetical protein IEQ34_004662 [Dendrobium chrysotoxum]
MSMSQSNEASAVSKEWHTSPIIMKIVPPKLKFLMANIESIISTHLFVDYHPTWRYQILKNFKANGTEGFLDGSVKFLAKYLIIVDNTPFHTFQLWMLINQNLSVALNYDYVDLTLQGNVDNLEYELLDHSLVPICDSGHSDVHVSATLMAPSVLPVDVVYENNVGFTDEMIGKDEQAPVVNISHNQCVSIY